MKNTPQNELVTLASKKADVTTVPSTSNIKSFDLGEFDEASLAKEEKSKRRWGWTVLIIGFGGFMAWGALAPLDQGAAMPGTVTVVGSSKVVQHPYGGVVDKILVKEGELVKSEQVLVQLDATKLQSEFETVRTQWITVKSKEARLMAELGNAPKITFPDWFGENANDPQVMASTKLQSELFRSRRDSRQAEIAALTENIQALSNSLVQLKIGMDGKREQLKYIQEQLAGLRGLEKEGYLARNRLLEAERQEAQIRSSLADDMGNLSRVEGQLAETRLRIAQRKSDLVTEVQAEMADVQRLVEELSNRMKSVNFDKDAALIRSPIEGYISNLQVATVGGVIAPGAQLMHVVPKDAPFKIDAQLQVHLVDKVQPGMPVDVMFPALNQRTTPHIPGVVKTVSADRIIDTASGMPYYLVQIDITPEGIQMLTKYQIVPGMPAEAFVKQGERTMLNYLFKPLTDRLHSAMTEE
jgi:membrane fusion protein, protease secretion system